MEFDQLCGTLTRMPARGEILHLLSGKLDQISFATVETEVRSSAILESRFAQVIQAGCGEEV